NTWMSASYGTSLKVFLKDYFNIKSIINFSEDVFPDADVESCIIHLEKKDIGKEIKSNHPIEFISIKEPLKRHEILSFPSLIFNGNLGNLKSKITFKKVENELLLKD